MTEQGGEASEPVTLRPLGSLTDTPNVRANGDTPAGKTGWDASVIGFGAWAIGADWGQADTTRHERALRAAAASGVNFFAPLTSMAMDVASAWCRAAARSSRDPIFVATKAGVVHPCRSVEHYSPENLIAGSTGAGKP